MLCRMTEIHWLYIGIHCLHLRDRAWRRNVLSPRTAQHVSGNRLRYGTVHIVPRSRSQDPCLPQQQDTIPHTVKISVLRSWRWAKDFPKHVELILEINKLLLLHLVGFSILLYLHWLCTVKHKSSLQIKYYLHLASRRRPQQGLRSSETSVSLHAYVARRHVAEDRQTVVFTGIISTSSCAGCDVKFRVITCFLTVLAVPDRTGKIK
jgi:hypothetical protein